MTWRYDKATGNLFAPSGSLAGVGRDGTLPAGRYTIGNQFYHPVFGAMTLRLTGPIEALIHGRLSSDSETPHIIIGLLIRQQIAASEDRELVVE